MKVIPGKQMGRGILRASVLTIVAMCVSPGIAAAQNTNSSNVFGGYSFIADNLFTGQHANLNGWNASVEKKYLPFFGVVADFAGLYGAAGPSSNGYCTSNPASPCFASSNVSQYSFQGGIRGSYAAKTFRPYAEALFGAIYTSENGAGMANSNIGFSATLGGGIDYRVMRIVGLRLSVDYIVTGNFSARQNSVRVSTGPVIYF